MGDSAEVTHTGEVGRESLNVTFVEVLAGFQEVDIVLLQLATLDDVLLLVRLLESIHHLSVAVIDQDMGVPQLLSNSCSSSVFEVEKDRGLTSNSESANISVLQ